MYQKSRTEALAPKCKKRIMIGTYVLGHGYYDAYYLQAQKIRRLIAQGLPAGLHPVRRDCRAGVAHRGLENR